MARKITPTHVLLNEIEVATAASTITFSSIPQGYADLVLELNTTGSDAVAFLYGYINGDTSNYSRVFAYRSSTINSGTSTTAGYHVIYGSKRQLNTINILDYSASDKHKTMLVYLGNAQHGEVVMQAVRWGSTAPITSIEFVTQSGTVDAGSTFRLYGVYG